MSGYLLRCPDCRGKFKWDDPTQGMPKFCPLCEAYVGNDRADDDVVMPFIRSARTKSVDGVFDQMVAASERRAEAAAQQLGVPVSDMSDLKITDLRPTKHAGDVAAVPVSNDVTRFMEANPQAAGFKGGDGLGYSGAVAGGFAPNVGARVRTAIQDGHRDAVFNNVVGTDERGRLVRPSTDVVSERPAVETMQPGYRRRG